MYVQLEIISFKYGEVIITGEGLQKWTTLQSAHKAFELEKTLSCNACCDTGPRFLRSQMKDHAWFTLSSLHVRQVRCIEDPFIIRIQTGLSIGVITCYGKRSTTKTIIAFSKQQHPDLTMKYFSCCWQQQMNKFRIIVEYF